MYGDVLLDRLSVKFLGPSPLDLELLHMLTTFHGNALGSTLGWWFGPLNRRLGRRKQIFGNPFLFGDVPYPVVKDCLAITLICDAAICIPMLRISNDLRQNRFPCGADEYYICPGGKHGCAVKFHFSESEQNILPRVQGYKWQCPTTQSPTQQHSEPQHKFGVHKVDPPPGEGQGVGQDKGGGGTYRQGTGKDIGNPLGTSTGTAAGDTDIEISTSKLGSMSTGTGISTSTVAESQGAKCVPWGLMGWYEKGQSRLPHPAGWRHGSPNSISVCLGHQPCAIPLRYPLPCPRDLVVAGGGSGYCDSTTIVGTEEWDVKESSRRREG